MPHPRPIPAPAPRRRRHHGIVMVYSLLLLSVLVGFCSFAVDYGRAQVVKAQLRRATDAAARAAVANVHAGIAAATNAATTTAWLNEADGSPVALDPYADVEFGTWNANAKTFSPLAGDARLSANALRITARRTAARGNAVPLMFARLLGKNSADVSASTIAFATQPAQPERPGFVGLDGVLAADLDTDSYDASAGDYLAVPHGAKGNFTSNNDLILWGSAIRGDVYKGAGDWVFGANITGQTKTLSSTLSYTAPTFPATNDNNQLNAKVKSPVGSFVSGNVVVSGAVSLPGGTYVVSSLTVSAPLTFTGPTQIYVTGDVKVLNGGSLLTYQNKPANLLIVGASDVHLWPVQPLYADVFSPNAVVTIGPASALGGFGSSNSSHFYGQVIARYLLSYNMNLHLDTSLPSHNPTGPTEFTTPASTAGPISIVN